MATKIAAPSPSISCSAMGEGVGDEALHIVEVQCGDDLREDDIVRLDDDYGRD